MLKVGEVAPLFTLPDSAGQLRSLPELIKNGPLVLFFYPADFTPVCTAEACMFRDRHADLARAGVTVVGVSPQSIDSHRDFRARHSLPYELLADPARSVIRIYAGTWLGLPMPFAARRVTYLIDDQRVTRDRVLADFSAAAHERIAAAALARSPSPSPSPSPQR